jgi:hypothetical protein
MPTSHIPCSSHTILGYRCYDTGTVAVPEASRCASPELGAILLHVFFALFSSMHAHAGCHTYGHLGTAAMISTERSQ